MSLKVLIPIFILFLTINFSLCEEDEEIDENYESYGKIVGGDLIEITEVPYFGSVLYKNRHLCGSSIITNQWVLTAAHCLVDLIPSNYKIHTGSSRKSQNGVISKVKKLIRHPKFNGSNINYDFMLIKLSVPIKFNKKQRAIKLASKGKVIPEGTDVRTSGFGLTNNDLESEEFLRAVTVQVSNHQFCLDAYDGFITNQMVNFENLLKF